MRKAILIYMFFAGTLSVFAENEDKAVKDTVSTDTARAIQEAKVIEKSPEEKLAEAQKTIEEQKKCLLSLRDVEYNLGIAQRDNDNLKKQLKDTEKRAESVEKSLITMASNFLYIPYEAYGVEEIAIKAFESVQNENLKREYNQRYVLLKNYQQHLRDLKAYLERVLSFPKIG